MSALKEFANFVTLNMANLAATYARLLVEAGYEETPANIRLASGRQWLKAVIEACEIENSAPFYRFSAGRTWSEDTIPPPILIELECLGQTLTPVITNLEAGKFIWQTLSELRATAVADQATSLSPAGPSPAINEFGQLLMAQPDPGSVYEKATHQLVERFQMAFARIWILHEQTNELELQASAGEYTHLDGAHSRIPLDSDFKLAWIVREATPHISNDLLHDPRIDDKEWAKENNMVAFAGYPLLIEDRLLGVLEIFSHQPIDEETEQQLQIVALFITAVANSHSLYDQAERRASELTTVAELSAQATRIRDPLQLLQTVADQTKEQFDLYHAHIYLLRNDALELAAGDGEVGRKLVKQGWRIPLDPEQSLVAKAAITRQGVIVNNVGQEPAFLPHTLLPDIRSEMAIPLIAGQSALGVLDVQADTLNRFTEEDIRIHTTLAAQIAAALENARLHEASETALAEMEQVYQAGAEITAADSYQDILHSLRQHTILGKETQNVSLNQFDRPWTADQKPEWIIVLTRWSELPAEAVQNRYPLAAFPSAEQLLSPDQPTLIEDVQTDPRMDENARLLYTERFGAASTIFVPLVVGGEWIGYVNAIYQQPATFPEAEIRRLVALAGQAAVAVQSLYRLAQSEQRAHEAQTIRQITDKMQQATSLAELTQITATQLAQQFSAEYGLVELGRSEKTNSE